METRISKKLTHWNQIRDEWPNEEIHLYGPGTASGTYDYFAEVICGKKLEQEEITQLVKMIMF